MTSKRAPVAYFCFNRPEHSERTLAALASNAESQETALHVFIDGPRHDTDVQKVRQIRELANRLSGFASVTVHAQAKNKGLYASVTAGVSRLMREHGRAIVVEDDVLVSPHFLAYMNQGLDQYAGDQRVGSIHGYCPKLPSPPDYFFLRGGDCWGWASWADRWQLFQPDAKHLLSSLARQGLVGEYCQSHGYRSLQLLCDRALGRNESWAILWHASLFLAGAHTLYPGRSFVHNIGNDGSGVHSKRTSTYDATPRQDFTGLPSLEPLQDESAARAFRHLLDGGTGAWPLRLARRWFAWGHAMASVRIAVRP